MTPEVNRINRAVAKAFKELDRLALVCESNGSPLRRLSFRNFPAGDSQRKKSIQYASCTHGK